MVFIDTNIWVYALSAQDHAKKKIAVDLISRSYRDDMICISSQVVKEFANYTAEQQIQMYSLFGMDLKSTPHLGLNLTILIPILVAVTQFLQTKLLMSRQAQAGAGNTMGAMKTMNYVMPLMLGFMAVTFPAFLGWYWLIQSLVMAIQQLIINKQLDKKSNEELVHF